LFWRNGKNDSNAGDGPGIEHLQTWVHRSLPAHFRPHKAQIAVTFAQENSPAVTRVIPIIGKRIRSRLEAVGKDDMQRVAKNFCNAIKLVILVVRAPKKRFAWQPGHDVKLTQLRAESWLDVRFARSLDD